MRYGLGRCVSVVVALLILNIASSGRAHAQAVPAVVNSGPAENASIFVMGSNTQTGFLGSNTALTAGLSLNLRQLGAWTPSLELRGAYPLSVASDAAKEMTFLGGPVIHRSFGRFSPYGNILFGYGRADYPADYIYNNYQYVRSSNFVYSPGAGLDYYLNPRLSIKLDAQFQHWTVPVTQSGNAWARSLSIGASYHLHAGMPHRQKKLDKNDPGWHKVSEDYPGTRR